LFGGGRFRYASEGLYTVSAHVAPQTPAGVPLDASVTIEVGGVGPTIKCDSPLNGAMVNIAPGSNVTFSGSLSDPNGIGSVMVNGAAATVSGTGTFTASVPTRFGINAVEIVARDAHGAENTRTCWFLAANQWAGESAIYGDTVALKLTQAAF